MDIKTYLSPDSVQEQLLHGYVVKNDLLMELLGIMVPY